MEEEPMSDPRFTRPDLCSISTAASRAEWAGAARGVLSADGHPVADDDPLASPRRAVARTLVEARFTLHHRNRHDPQYRLGGVCLMPIPAQFGIGRSGIAACWSTRNLLLVHWAWRATFHCTRDLMNAVLTGALHAFGYPVRQLGTVGARLMTGDRGQRTRAGR
jgi:hypothetical protein